MSIYFVDSDFLAHSTDSSKIENLNSSEVETIVGCQQDLLGIHTPLYIRAFQKEEKPLELFPDLLTNKKYIKYEHPDTYLVQVDPKDKDYYYFNVQIIDTVKSLPVPNFYVPFNYQEYINKSCDDIINQIKTVFTFDPISPELFVGNLKCQGLKGSDIFNRIIKEKAQLTLKCELTDAADKVIRMRQNVLAEVISTEKTYIHDLKTIIDYWKPQLENLKFLKEDESRAVFKDINIILSYQNTFLSELEKRGTEFSANIADVFIMFSHFFKSSKLYISNYQNVVKILTEKEQTEKFTEKIEDLSKATGGRDLASFLITPVQRMPRYILFLRELLKYTPQFHPDRPLLEISYNEIEKVTREIDKSSEIAKRQQLLYRIQISLSSTGISILEASRNIEKIVNVKLLHYPKYSESKSKTKLYLFNDLIIIITKKSTKRVAVFYSLLSDVSYVRNLPTFDSVTFCTNHFPTQKKGSLEEFCSVRFETPQVRDDLMKFISSKTNYMNDDFYIKDIAMSYLPPILSGHKTAPIDNIIYSFGGHHGLKDVVGFDISSGSIYYYKALLPTLEGHSVVSIGEDIYICGGQSNNKFREETWKWNPNNNIVDNNKRTSKSILISKNGFSARIDQSMSAWGDKLVVFGGKGIALTTYYNNVAIFDTLDIQAGWKVYNDLENKPASRSGHTSIVYKNFLIIYGGKNDKGILSDLSVLNLENMTWETPELKGDSLPPRVFHESVLIEGTSNMITFGGNEDASLAHIINLDTFTVQEIKILGNIIPSLNSFSLSTTHENDLIILGGKSKNYPTNLVQYIQIPSKFKQIKSIDQEEIHVPSAEIRKKITSVTCTPISADDKENIEYVLESQNSLLNKDEDDDEQEYEYDDNKPEKSSTTLNSNKVENENINNKNVTTPQQTNESESENKKDVSEKVHKKTRFRFKLFSVSKDDFSLPAFVNISLFLLPALAVFFIAFCGLSKFVLIGTLICLILTGLIVLIRKYLIKQKERVLESVLSNEIKTNDGYANKVAFLLKYNVPSCVLEAFMKKNEKTKKFVFTTKTVDGSTFDAIELAK